MFNSFSHHYFACLLVYLFLKNQFQDGLSLLTCISGDWQGTHHCHVALTKFAQVFLLTPLFLVLGALFASILIYLVQRLKWIRFLSKEKEKPDFDEEDEIYQKYQSLIRLSWQGFKRLGMRMDPPKWWGILFFKSSSYLLFFLILIVLSSSDHFNQYGMFSLFILALERYFLFGIFFVILEIKLSNLEIA